MDNLEDEDEYVACLPDGGESIPCLSQHFIRLSHAQVNKPINLFHAQWLLMPKSDLTCTLQTCNNSYNDNQSSLTGNDNTPARSGQLGYILGAEHMLRKSCSWNNLSRGSQFVQRFNNQNKHHLVCLFSTGSKVTNDNLPNTKDSTRKQTDFTSKQTAQSWNNLESEARDSYYDNYLKLFGGCSQYPTHQVTDRNPHGVGQIEPPDSKEPVKSRHALTHTDQAGHAKMVDVGHKSDTRRRVVATGVVFLGCEAFDLVAENRSKKGDVLSIAQVAGIMAVKNTSNLIPLCHNLILNKIDLDLLLNPSASSVNIRCEVHTTGKTGVEMEALVGVSVAALTVYDMCKAVTHDIIISNIKLIEKEGGQSGHYKRS